MNSIKAILKPMILGAFLLGFIGLFIGGLAALIVWPEANLGPPVGAVCGLFIGILLGSVLGVVFGMVRLPKPRVTLENPDTDERAH
jgi:hypothetical protein